MLKSSLNGSQNQSAPPSSHFNYDDVGSITGQLQHSSLEDTEKPRLWSPQDDKIFTESADSDMSESFRDLSNGSISHSVSESPLTHIITSPRRGSLGSYSGSPIITDKKWHPQSPESSRFFSGGPGDIPRDIPSPSYSSAFESLDRSGGERFASERSPNAVAVMHSSPLDLSFPVKDSRVSSHAHDFNGSLALGLGLGIAQEKRGMKNEDSIDNVLLYKNI